MTSNTVKIVAAPGGMWTARADGELVPVLPSYRIKGFEDVGALRYGSPGCLAIQSLSGRVEILGYDSGWFTKVSERRCRQPGPFFGLNWLQAMAISDRVAIGSSLWGTMSWLHHGLWQASDFVAPVGRIETGAIVLGERTPAAPPPRDHRYSSRRRSGYGGRRFGVYVIRHSSTAIYIGKGARSRPTQHFVDASNPGLRDYLKQYPECSWEFVLEDAIETHALACERQLIARYGRRDLGTGTLFNLSDGG